MHRDLIDVERLCIYISDEKVGGLNVCVNDSYGRDFVFIYKQCVCVFVCIRWKRARISFYHFFLRLLN